MGETVNKEKKAPEVVNVSVNEEVQDLQNQQIQELQNQQQQIQGLQNRNQQIQGERNANINTHEANIGNISANQSANLVAVEEARRTVRSNMPPQFDTNVNANKEVKVEYRAKLPKDMVALLDEIAGWEKVKQETSVPVKKAAEELKKAKNDTDAADAMADLAVACAHYMQINGSKYFKSKRRKQVVTELMSKITGFISNADLVYYTSFEFNVDRLRENAADGKLEAKLSTFESELNASLISANGVKTVEEAAAIMGERGLLRKECAEREAKRLAGFSDLSDEEKAELRPYTDEDRKRLYEKIKNDQKKDMTEEQFKIYVRATSTEPLLSCPEYHAKYNKVAGLFASYGANGTFSRDV